jgi:membrane protein
MLKAVRSNPPTPSGEIREKSASSPTQPRTLAQSPITVKPEKTAMPFPSAIWPLFKAAGAQWLEDKAPRLGAALAYYTVFSLAPLLVIVIAIAGFVFGAQAAEGQLTAQIRNLVGEEGAQAIQAMVASANKPATGTLAAIAGVVMLLIGAAGLFGQLQDALDTIWEVEPKPGQGVWGFVRARFLSISMVLGTAFLLLVSLVVSAALAALGGLAGGWGSTVIGHVLDLTVRTEGQLQKDAARRTEG